MSAPASVVPGRAHPLLIATAILLFVLNAFFAFLLVTSTADMQRGTPYLVGALVGTSVVAAAIVLLVYGVARAMGKARTPSGRAALVSWTLTALLVLNVLNLANAGTRGRSLSQASGRPVVTASERRGLEAGGDSIRHAGLRFALPHPGPKFSPAAEFQRQLDATLEGHPDMAAWAFSDAAGSQTLIVQLGKLAQVDEAGFRDFTRGIRNGAHRPGRTTILLDTLMWQGGDADYRLDLQHVAGIYLKMRCVRRLDPGVAVVVCAQTISPQVEGLDAVRAGLTLSAR